MGGGVGASGVFAFGLDAARAEGLGEGGFGFGEGLRGEEGGDLVC